MGRHERSDYQFSDQKVLFRSSGIKEVGSRIAEFYSDVARGRHGIDTGIVYLAHRHDAMIVRYFSGVADFKYRHEFGLADKINPAKMAAIFVDVIITENNKSRLFDIPAALVGRTLDDVIVYEFIYRIVCRILEIDIQKVPFSQQRDLILCIDRYGADVEWIAWGMYSFGAAYGCLANKGD